MLVIGDENNIVHRPHHNDDQQHVLCFMCCASSSSDQEMAIGGRLTVPSTFLAVLQEDVSTAVIVVLTFNVGVDGLLILQSWYCSREF